MWPQCLPVPIAITKPNFFVTAIAVAFPGIIARIAPVSENIARMDSDCKIARGTQLLQQFSKQGSTPTPWARGLRDRIQKGRARDRKPFMHRVYIREKLKGNN